MKIESDYCNKELSAELKELGCPVWNCFTETPEGESQVDIDDLMQIQVWLGKEKGVFIYGRFIMFAKSEEKLSYSIVMHGREVYNPQKRWLLEQKEQALYDGIKKAVEILKRSKMTL